MLYNIIYCYTTADTVKPSLTDTPPNSEYLPIADATQPVAAET